jgi:hypothetical protein
MFTRQDLDRLLAIDARPVVSIFQPGHRAGREVRQDPIRLRKMLGAARVALAQAGLRRPEVEALLAPGGRLIDDQAFWRRQDRGLAVFLAPGVCHVHRLPIDVREQLVVAPRIHLTPLLGVIELDARFLVLTVNAARARLFEATRDRLSERTDVALPSGSAVIAQTEFQEMRHASPVGRPHAPTPRIASKSQGFGDTPEAVRKAELVEFLHRLIAALEPQVKARAAPIVLIAQPEIQGHLRALVDWPTLIDDAVADNPDALDPAALHARAWAVVRPRVEAGRTQDLDRLNALLGSADAKATLRIEEIVRAARDGRVDTLFLAEGATLWGRFDPAVDRLEAHGRAVAGDEDLLDYAAIETLRHRGHVGLMAQTALPRQRPIAAILRY